IIINSVSCPFTVLLNVLVIMAVKKRPSLQSNTNILLSCLAVTDLLTGLIVQPSFVAWKSFYVLKSVNVTAFMEVQNYFLRFLTISSSLHLMLATCERLLAVKYTNYYSYIVRKRNIKVSVLAIWSFSFVTGVLSFVKSDISKYAMKTLHFFALSFSIIFIVVTYIILYRETLRHRKRIRTQQLPQTEIERFVKENKALKTTVLVVGAVLLCFLPMTVYQLLTTVLSKQNQLLLFASGEMKEILSIVIRTPGMLNSLVNPLIYCMRQKEMRKFVFSLRFSHSINPIHNYFLRAFIISSSLHLMLVTCERLLAIKYTNHYLYIATRRNIKVSVVLSWFFSFIISGLRYIKYDISRYVMKTLHFLAISFSVVFIVVAYVILYLETLHHRKKIRTQQLPQQEIERFVKENKALKTTVLVVGAVVLCFLPMAVYQLLTTLSSRGNKKLLYDTELVEFLTLMVRTASMLNSLVNPLIYCMRQKELRKFVSRLL
ncbi:unnamed protein product, partial [Porites evermanni]